MPVLFAAQIVHTQRPRELEHNRGTLYKQMGFVSTLNFLFPFPVYVHYFMVSYE